MANIAELLSNIDNTVLYPLTKTKAVTNDEGTSLDTLLSDETQARISGDQNLQDQIDNIESISRSEIDGKADKATTLSGYGITNAYTKLEVDTLVSSVFHYKGTKSTYVEVATLTNMAVGDVWQVTADNSEYVYNGSSWEKLGPTIDLSGYLTNITVAGRTLTPSYNFITAAQLRAALELGSAAYAETASSVGNNISLPTGNAVKNFVEGKGYTTNTGTITGVYVNGSPVATSGIADLSIPTKISDLPNDSGFISSYTETDPTVPSWAKQPSKPTYTASEVGALPDTVVVPSKTSDLVNDSGFVRSISPAFTGIPTAPTASAGTNTTQLATTAFVSTATSGLAPIDSPLFSNYPRAKQFGLDGGDDVYRYLRTDSDNNLHLYNYADDTHKVFADTSVTNNLAPKASPTFTGTPKAPTAAAGTNTTQIATTAFVNTAISGLANFALKDLAGGSYCTVTHSDMVIVFTDRGGMWFDGKSGRTLTQVVSISSIVCTRATNTTLTVRNTGSSSTRICAICAGTVSIA